MNNLQLPQKNMEKERAALESFIKSDRTVRELKRAVAVRMAIEGKLYHGISKIWRVSKFFIGYWKKQFKTKGIAGIKLGHKGSKGYLTSLHKTEVMEWLKNKEYWDFDELVTYLEREFGVSYKSKQSYYALLSLAKITWKKTQKINPKSNPKLVKKKRKEINKILAKNKVGIESGEIIVFFLDECHLLHGDINGYAWGRSDLRIEVPITNQKNRQTYFGARSLSNQTIPCSRL
ncbi:winged helix-turn-helix domain-containing protein [Microcoleus sp. herbarium8]|uniref:helix-turn-helix domain-containing protein n=1 Tax=Microcoleus sp. herbarium8 TaxID=3055436 RepID=UPI002FD5CAAE